MIFKKTLNITAKYQVIIGLFELVYFLHDCKSKETWSVQGSVDTLTLHAFTSESLSSADGIN